MLVFISGSINSGKTTTSKALAKRLGSILINVDDLNAAIPNFNLATDLDKSMDLAIKAINDFTKQGKDVVALKSSDKRKDASGSIQSRMRLLHI